METLCSDWNPHADLQAMARAHRLGQTNKVWGFSIGVWCWLFLLLLNVKNGFGFVGVNL